MSLKWIEGFEVLRGTDENLPKKYFINNTTSQYSIAGGNGRFGTRGIRGWVNSTITTPILGTASEWYVGFAYGVGVPGVSTNILMLGKGTVDDSMEPSNVNMSLRSEANPNEINYKIVVDLGSSGQIGWTPLATGIPNLAGDTGDIANGWYYVELGCHFHASTGWFELKINENLAASGYNINTIGSATDQPTDTVSFALNAKTGSPQLAQARMDDIYILTNDGILPTGFLGVQIVEGVFVTGDSPVYNDWNRSDGTTGYALVDDLVPDGDATYVFVTGDGASSGVTQMYRFDTLEFITGNINGVMVGGHFRVTENSTESFKYAYSQTGGTPQEQTDNNTLDGSSLTYEYFSNVYGRNPATSAVWTTGEISTGHWGYIKQ